MGDYKPFDYGTFFDEDGMGVAGSSRWGNMPSISLANSKEGKKLITDGMKFTRDTFMERLKSVREMIGFYSDEELFKEKIMDTKKKILESLKDKNSILNDVSMFKYSCSCLGEYVGGNIYVYGNDGEGIRNDEELKRVLNKWKCVYEDEGKENPYKDLNIYVTPIDVHS